MNLKINNYLMLACKFVLFVGLFFVLFNSSVNYLIFPFAFGMLFALAWANQKVWLVAPAYIIAGVIFKPTMEFAICMLVCMFCLLVPYFVHVLCKKNMKKWEFALFAIVGQTANMVLTFWEVFLQSFPL